MLLAVVAVIGGAGLIAFGVAVYYGRGIDAQIDEALADMRIEAAYWEFDARRKGYAPFKNSPQSERDAFKSTVRRLLAGEEALR